MSEDTEALEFAKRLLRYEIEDDLEFELATLTVARAYLSLHESQQRIESDTLERAAKVCEARITLKDGTIMAQHPVERETWHCVQAIRALKTNSQEK